MASTASPDLAARIAEESATLPAEKLASVLDYVLFMKHQAAQAEPESEGDAAWERIIADPRPRPKLEAYLKSIEAEGCEPLDLSRL
jgi:hypothetical protein